ncbi:MAG TPA: alpha/beta hydrolase [Prosthecochloris aestuarii]|uniref:Alpha/beta hydrolase n=1 Tax=Prosthecochloris aestuarii TaxID=1102 RepID=A0A831SQ66_PROAE|nr:alpha/beta hydrolase [Prosthecochloris aestuarii]
MQPKELTITLQNYRHRYIDTGTPGRRLVLLHGISCSLDIYEEVIDILSGSFRVLALDLLGFGKSEKPRNIEYSLQLYAELLREFIRETSDGNDDIPFILGHSMGGKYALAAALLHPGLFGKLVLVNTDGFTPLPGWIRAISWPGIRQVLTSLMTSNYVAGRAFEAAFHRPDSIRKTVFEKNLLTARNREAVDTVMALNRNYRQLDLGLTGLKNQLSAIDIPVLILWGDHDKYILPQTALRVQHELPGSELIMFRNCGHTPMLEYPKLFSNTVTRFLLNSQDSAANHVHHL